MKLDPTGKKVIYATYLGVRRESTQGMLILADAGGNAYVSGTTTAAGFPVTPGAYQSSFVTTPYSSTSFLVKLNPTGTALVYSTFIHADALAKGGESLDSMAIDSGQNIFLTGSAQNFTTTPGAFQTMPPPAGHAFPFVAKLNATGTAMLYATYLGQTINSSSDSIGVDSYGNAYMTGTAGDGFPLLNALNSNTSGIFVAKLNSTGTALGYSTMLGSGWFPRLAVDQSGQAVVVGSTDDSNFMVSPGAFQNQKGYPGMDVSNGFVVKLATTGSLIYSSFLGGTNCSCADNIYNFEDEATHVAIDPAGYAYVGGKARSRNFPAIDSVGGAP